MEALITPQARVRSQQAAAQVFDELRDMILSLKLAPGTVLSRLRLQAQFGVSSEDIAQGRETAGFRALMDFQIARAQRHYDEAFAKLPAVDRKSQRPGIMMAAIYRTLLDEIRAAGCHVLNQRISLTPVRKMWIAWKTWVKG